MQEDFHYYATYCASFLAGYSHEESLAVAYSAQFTDCCTRTFLQKIGAPLSAATTQTQTELANVGTDIPGQQDITRIWASFHFLPRDLYAKGRKHAKLYNSKYRLICGPNGELVKKTVELAAKHSLYAAGLAMHVLADTWAHRYFAGTPSSVINNTNFYFYELMKGADGEIVSERPVIFQNNPALKDNVEKGVFVNTVYQPNETSVMCLGHGRAGHLPDYSYICYRYLPAWGNYNAVIKDNPSDYLHAFTQMIYALKWLKSRRRDAGAEKAESAGNAENAGNAESTEFETDRYDFDAITGCQEQIHAILTKRRLNASADWKEFGEQLSGQSIPDFDVNRYAVEYTSAEKDRKDSTVLGHFILAALRQKSMVTNQIYQSGNPSAGFSIDYNKRGLKGIKDFYLLLHSEPEEEMYHE